MPLVGSQVPAPWHGSAAGHIVGMPGMHEPVVVSHCSRPLHGLPSSHADAHCTPPSTPPSPEPPSPVPPSVDASPKVKLKSDTAEQPARLTAAIARRKCRIVELSPQNRRRACAMQPLSLIHI